MSKQEFIENIAQAVRKIAPEFGIKVYSPIIAQACLESAYGTSNKAKYNNYFGLKYREGRLTCHKGTFVDGSSEQLPDGSYVPISDQWYSFETLEDCVRGYFQFTNIDRYKNLKGVTDARQYLELIKEDGYATSLKYVDNVYKTLINNSLLKYDKEDINMKRVCIDPGHYGKYNRCPAIPEYYESDMNWKLSNLQVKYLKELGVDAILTRCDKNKDMELYDRGMKSKGCDLFISNHSNATTSMREDIDYVALYHLVNDDTTTIDETSKKYAEALAPVIAKLMNTKQGYKVLSSKSSQDRNGDGIMNDNYYGVLNGARIAGTPGLIIEHSFHTNSAAVRWLLNDDNLDKMARAESEVIASLLLGKTVTLNKVETKPAETKPTETKPAETKKEPATSNVLYKVQVGAFSMYPNAVNRLNEVKSKGYTDAFITKVGNYHKVQVGAYSVKKNAENMLKKVQKSGYKDAFIAEVATTSTKPVVTKKSDMEIAKEVIAGKWGNGNDRKNRLTAAGYNYSTIQQMVNILCK